jgi:hypothetical protein
MVVPLILALRPTGALLICLEQAEQKHRDYVKTKTPREAFDRKNDRQ